MNINLIIVIISLLLVCFVVFIWYIRKKSKLTETFQSTSNKLTSVKHELRQLLTNSNIDIYEKAVGFLDEDEIVFCVQKTLQQTKIPLDLFYMDGVKMSDPIIQMYMDNQKIYNILAKCKFLDLIGRIVFVAAIAQTKTQNLEKHLECLDKIDFTDISVWKTMADPNGIVLKCVNS